MTPRTAVGSIDATRAPGSLGGSGTGNIREGLVPRLAQAEPVWDLHGDALPEATVARFAVYLRVLTTLFERHVASCTSHDLAAAAGVTSAGLRQDLSHVGSCSRSGTGYDVANLLCQISRVFGLSRCESIPIIIAGIGNLGQALANHWNYGSTGLAVVALLDEDPIRQMMVVAGLPVMPLDTLGPTVRTHEVSIGVISTPAPAAQDVAIRMVAAGITSILSFAPAVITVADGVEVRSIDLSTDLHILVHHQTAQGGPHNRNRGPKT